LPLLQRLGIAVIVECWAEAAISALRANVSPYGDNQNNDDSPGRCKSCFIIKPKKALFLCSACGKTRYCGTECSARDWEAHRPCCEVLGEKKKKYKGVPEPVIVHPCTTKITAPPAGCTSGVDGTSRGSWMQLRNDNVW
jgi:hypothetical protein